MITVSFQVNGRVIEREVEDRTLLIHFIRDHLDLTGSHVGCDTTQCGACVVHMDGRSVKACTVLAASADGAVITTIEGIAEEGSLHPLQAAFNEYHGLQCGYCTPGMIMTALDILRRHGAELDETILCRELDGNICRCTGYQNIIRSIMSVCGASHAQEEPGAI